MTEKFFSCAACEWSKSLEDSVGRLFWFCMNADSLSFLEETGLLGGCTMEVSENREDGTT